MKRTFVRIVVAAALLLSGGCSVLAPDRARQLADQEPTPTPIPTAIVPVSPTYVAQRGAVTRELEFLGRVAPVRSQPLFFRSAGRLERLAVRLGQDVKAGQILAELDVERLQREVTGADLRLQRARARQAASTAAVDRQTRRAQLQLQIAQLNRDAAREAQPPDEHQIAILELQVGLAKIAVEEAGASADPQLAVDVEQAKLDLERARAELAAAQIVAPFDGRVLELAASEGRAVEAFKPLVVVGDLSRLEVAADLQSQQNAELAVGMPAQLIVVGARGAPWAGAIRALPASLGELTADADRSTRVEVTEPGAVLELGQLVRVVTLLENKPDALWLPPQAIRAFEGRTFVLAQDGDTQRRVDVQVGIRGPERVEIVSGIEAGQTVIAP